MESPAASNEKTKHFCQKQPKQCRGFLPHDDEPEYHHILSRTIIYEVSKEEALDHSFTVKRESSCCDESLKTCVDFGIKLTVTIHSEHIKYLQMKFNSLLLAGFIILRVFFLVAVIIHLIIKSQSSISSIQSFILPIIKHFSSSNFSINGCTRLLGNPSWM